MQLLFEPSLLVGFCLVLARASAWVAVCPPFNSPAIPVRIRAGIAVAVSFALARRVGEQVTDVSTVSLVGGLFSQLLAGFVLGFFVFMIFSAVQSAGELIDLQVGFSYGGLIDPISGNNSTPIGRLHQLLAMAILFAINGHVLVARAFVHSVDAAPLGHVGQDGMVEAVTQLFGVLLRASLEIALPILTALFFAEIALGFLGKAAPQLNVLVIGFAVKAGLAFALLGATLVMLPETVDSLLGRALRAAMGVFAR